MIMSYKSPILIGFVHTDHNLEISSFILIEAKKDYVKISTTDNSYIDRIKKNIIYAKNDVSFKIGRSYSKKCKFRCKVIYLANNTPVNWDYAKFWVDFLLYCCIY